MQNEFQALEALESRIAPAGFVFGSGGGIVNVAADTDQDGQYESIVDSFTPFANYKGPVTVASGDFDGDGNDELVTAIAKGKNAVVKVWDLSSSGKVGSLLDFFTPFQGSKANGISIAAGDLNADGFAELVVGAGPGSIAEVKVFSDTNFDGRLSDNQTDLFTAFDTKFKGGVRLALGDTNNAGGQEIVAGMWSKGGSVTIFSDTDNDLQISDETALETGLPFGAKFKKGVHVASGTIENAGGNGAEVIVGNAKGASTVIIFADSTANGLVFDDAAFDTLSSQVLGFKQGAVVAAGDTDDSGAFVEVIVSPADGSRVKIFDDNGDMGFLISDNDPDYDSGPIPKSSGGINLAFGKVRSETYSTGSPVPISDLAVANSSIFVSSGAGIIRDLNVGLSIAHTFAGDLDVTLTHVPTGTSVVLFTDIGGTDEGFIIRLDDEAGTDIGTADNPNDGPVTGVFNPEGAALLSAFDGLDAAGEWRLSVSDDSAGDVGTLFSWSLTFTM